MDLKKYKKPIHFTCPKCKADFEFAGGEIMRQKNELLEDIKVIKARMQNHRNEHGKDGYYFKLVKQLNDKEAQYQKAKHAVQIASEQSEIHLFILFKMECKRRFGDEVINQILEECEQELTYRVYDMAIQDHTNFENA